MAETCHKHQNCTIRWNRMTTINLVSQTNTVHNSKLHTVKTSRKWQNNTIHSSGMSTVTLVKWTNAACLRDGNEFALYDAKVLLRLLRLERGARPMFPTRGESCRRKREFVLVLASYCNVAGEKLSQPFTSSLGLNRRLAYWQGPLWSSDEKGAHF